LQPDDEVRYLKGVGPARAELLRKLGIRTVEHLLFHLPRRYADRSTTTPTAELEAGTTATVAGVVERVSLRRLRGRGSVVTARLADESGKVELVWFNQPYVAERIGRGTLLVVTGRVTSTTPARLVPTEWAPHELAETGLLPVYPATEGLGQRMLRRLVRSALENVSLQEHLPDHILERRGLPRLRDALQMVHFPDGDDERDRGMRRLKYDEFLLMQLTMLGRRRKAAASRSVSVRVTAEAEKRILRRLPHEPTDAQRRVMNEIKADLAAARPMMRLLQGDVGCGKTMVAVYALLAAVESGAQAALMAPTEILAEQHYLLLRRLLSGGRVRIALLTSSTRFRKRHLEHIKSGLFNIVVGTHALLVEKVAFRRLAVVVIDEQHKFGVAQRERLLKKADAPNLLVMTATPIPRSLALTVFGDTDISTIDRMPPGRAPVVTRPATPDGLDEVAKEVASRLALGERAYVVSPSIEPMEATRGALEAAAWWRDRMKPHRVALLHGRMGRGERERVMRAFRLGAVSALVATTVIEVGIDVPAATMMVVENAERFGMAQLHQLRGRVGRGGKPGTVWLVSRPTTDEAKKRLAVLVETSDGFRISEEDLRLRGPGELTGVRQSGLPESRAAHLVDDMDILLEARKDAERLLEEKAAGRVHVPLRLWVKRKLKESRRSVVV